MKMKLTVSLFLVLAVLVCLVHEASAATSYPTKPIEFIAPSGPGGGWDLTARLLAKVLQEEKLVPVPIRVTNMPGGSGTVALASISSNRRGDPHTLAVFSTSLLLMIAMKEVPLSIKDFTPVAGLTTDYGVLIVKKDSPYPDLPSFFQDYRKKRGAIPIAGGSAPGGQDHVGVASVVKAAGFDPSKMNYIAYQGSGDAMLSLLGGHVDAAFGQVSTMVSQFEGGKVRPLAIFSDKRLGSPFQDVPTGKEQGINLVNSIWRGMYMPPGVSKEHVLYWDGIFRKLQTTKAWQVTLDKYKWSENYIPGDRFDAFIAKEVADYEGLLREVGFLK